MVVPCHIRLGLDLVVLNELPNIEVVLNKATILFMVWAECVAANDDHILITHNALAVATTHCGHVK